MNLFSSKETRRWLTVAAFALAMAWVEAAVVFYLRTMINRIDPYQAYPLPVIGGLGLAEVVREFATLVMLLTVGLLAANNWRSRLGYSAIAFGIWDIFYYVFLKVLCDWPHSLFDWDILFLIPLPWWGPVLAPVLISLLMVLWGTLASQIEQKGGSELSNLRAWSLNIIGTALALYVFMVDALHASHGGGLALRRLLPTRFDWPLFTLALLLMAAPVMQFRLVLRSRGRSEGHSAPEIPCKQTLPN